MLKEIRMYWRLRPYINQLKELFAMKFSVNILIQILATIAQALNQIGDLFPPDHRMTVTLIIGVIQAVVALMAHFKNPDGTSAKLPYDAPKSVKLPSVFTMLLLFPMLTVVQAHAADAAKFGVLGIGAGSSDTEAIQGWGALGIGLSDRLISFSDMDVAIVKGTTFQQALNNDGLQYTVRTGAAFRIYDPFKWLSIWGLGDAGIAAGGVTGYDGQTVVSGSFAGGGFLHIKLNSVVGGLIILQVDKNATTGRKFIPRFGLKVKL